MFNIFENPVETSSSDETEISSNYSIRESNASSASSLPSSKTFVVSVGGSVIFDGKPNTEFISKLSKSLNALTSRGYKFVLVPGGGTLARELISSAKTLGASNFSCDEFGIMACKINGMFLLQGISNVFPSMVEDVREIKQSLLLSNIIVLRGHFMPASTSDTMAAIAAENLGCPMINLTNVDGFYSNDPRVDPSALLFEKLSFKRLIQLIAREGLGEPGQHVPLDIMTSLVLNRSKITTYIVNAHNFENLENLVQGLQFKGTTIYDDKSNSSKIDSPALSSQSASGFANSSFVNQTTSPNSSEQESDEKPFSYFD